MHPNPCNPRSLSRDLLDGGTSGAQPNAFYYDWTQKAQRIEHGAGNYECVQ
jgi:hypothetical protein